MLAAVATAFGASAVAAAWYLQHGEPLGVALPEHNDGVIEEFRAPPGDFVNLSFGRTHYILEGEGPVTVRGDDILPILSLFCQAERLEHWVLPRIMSPPHKQVVFVHGFMGTVLSWRFGATEIMKRGYRTLRFDLYGCGWSASAAAPYNAALFASQLAELLFALKITDPVHIIGSSMGGAIATYFAATYPEKVGSLGLVAPAGYGVSKPAIARFAHVPGITTAVHKTILGIQLQRLRASFPGTDIVLEPSRLEPQFVQHVKEGEEWIKYQHSYNPAYTRTLLRTLTDFNFSGMLEYFEEVGTHSYPVAIVWGTADQTIPYSNLVVLQKAITRLSILTVPEGSHMVEHQNPELVAKHLDANIQSTLT